MKVLLFLDELVIGGIIVNAIEMAGVLRQVHGVDVVLYAGPGPLLKFAEQRGVPFLPAPYPSFHPSQSRVRALCEIVRRERPDMVWAWEPFACFDAYWGVQVGMQIPVLMTIMLMDTPYHLPSWPITTYGTPELVEKAERLGGRCVKLLLPPVDVASNAPGAVDPKPFKDRYGLINGSTTLVTVSRLANSMKSESLFRTINAVGALGRDLPLQFVVVGDGAARSKLERAANSINDAFGRRVILFTGAMLDPRPAYAAADIVIGMGGSALRGMAFGKPVIVVGEKGFSAPFTAETADSFFHKGFYGLGDGSPSNAQLASHIRMLAERPDPTLGAFSREYVVRNFSVEIVSGQVVNLFRRAVNERLPVHVLALDAFRSAALYFRYRRFQWRYIPGGASL